MYRPSACRLAVVAVAVLAGAAWPAAAVAATTPPGTLSSAVTAIDGHATGSVGFPSMLDRAAPTTATIRASVSSREKESNGESGGGELSRDGRFLAFGSAGSNLVPGDTNDTSDAFVRDLRAGQTRLVSVSSAGAQGNGPSHPVGLSTGGRYVGFFSEASNLLPGDTNEAGDVFVRDMTTATTVRASVSSDGAEGNARSVGGSMSADGRYVAFYTPASNLVPGDTNDVDDVFVRDMRTGTTERVSLSSGGTEGNAASQVSLISASGRYVAFFSHASDLVAGDTNGFGDAFVRDLRTGTTERVSVSGQGVQGNHESLPSSISADGRFVAITSYASTLVSGDDNGWPDVFLRDRVTGTTRLVSLTSDGAQPHGHTDGGQVSDDGRYVVFDSTAPDVVPNDANTGPDFFGMDVYIRDMNAGTTALVNVNSNGQQALGESMIGSITPDARVVAFTSGATNLVPHDTNTTADVFLRTTR
jgi:hypothetical protein